MDRPRPRRGWIVASTLLLAAGLISPAAAAAAADSDHDGLPNTWERTRSLTNPYRADTNRNGIPDGREDPDRDGLRNAFEFLLGTNPRRADTNRNGVADGREDPDHDGLTNALEQRFATNPRLADTDRDGWSDIAEIRAGTDPRKAASHPAPVTPTAPPTLPPGGGTSGTPTLPGAPGCPVFPGTNVWNTPVDTRAIAADSAAMISAIGLTRGLHMDFGSNPGYGIPYQVVTSATPRSTVAFDYADESDQVGYPIPSAPLIEGGSDHHILLVDKDACRLYELYDARQVGGAWAAGSGATWDLRSNALRPAGWTSADAAGLPILPGLVRYDEVASGAIDHALRFTTSQTRTSYIYPARHQAGSSASTALPPMGLRVRLRSDYDTSRFSPQAKVIADALKRYGMILADNGSPWYITGASDPAFDDGILHELDVVTGSDLQVVDTSGLVSGP